MKFTYIEKAFKAVVASAIALGLVASISTYASGPAEPRATALPTPTAQPR